MSLTLVVCVSLHLLCADVTMSCHSDIMHVNKMYCVSMCGLKQLLSAEGLFRRMGH